MSRAAFVRPSAACMWAPRRRRRSCIARIRAEVPGLEARPEWKALRAVRQGQISLADGNQFFNRPGPRLVESLEILAGILHPEAFRFGHEGSGWQRLPPF